MSLYALARYNTAPDVVKFACRNGIKENPMYMKCEECANQSFCEIYFNLTPAPEFSPEESESVNKSFAEEKNKLTPAEQWKEIRTGMAVVAVILFLGWLLS